MRWMAGSLAVSRQACGTTSIFSGDSLGRNPLSNALKIADKVIGRAGGGPGTVRKLIALGYLEGEGDEQAEGIAIEAYLGDSL
jgi:hypothetical protein